MYSNVNQQKRAIDYGDQQQWGGPSGDGYSSNEGSQKKKRKSRWGKDDIQEKTVIPGMPTVIPANLTKEQEQQYLLHLQIEEKSRRLRTGDLGIPPNPEDRSPSPEPIYNNEGKRLNTREYRTRKRLEEDRHRLVQEALALNSNYKPPPDYKPPLLRVNDKVMIPQEEHPDINFVGLLIGPRGNTLKTLEKETGAKIIIRGKGSVKDGKIGRKDGQPLPGEDEPLHAYVTANNPEYIKKAVEKIKSIIKESIEVPEGQNDLRKQQLRELALLNGTLRENDGLAKLKQLAHAQTIVTNTIICQNCGGAGHLSKDCKQTRPGETFHMVQQQESSSSTDKAKMDREYLSLMAELGQGPPPPKQTNNVPSQRPQVQQQQQQQQPSFTQPPPNPMGGFNNFQSSRFPPPMLLSMNNTRPPLSTMQNNQMSHQNIQSSGYHGNQPQNPTHPAGGLAQFKPHASAPQPVAPPVSMSSQYQQSMQQISAPVPVPPVPPPPTNSYGAPMPPPSWTGTVAVSQVNALQTQSSAVPLGGLHPPTSMMTAPPPLSSMMTAPPPPSSMMTALPPPSSMMTAPPPLSSMLTAPPPPTSMMTAPPLPSSMMTTPPPSSMMTPPPPSSMLTAPPPPTSMMTALPPPSSMMTAPPPPTSMMTAPPMPTLLMSKPPPPPPSSNQLHTGPHMSWLQQGSVQPPPPIQSPWQQTGPPPSQVSMTMPWQQVARPAMPNTVIPPPPPPTTVQGFSMPPPPPGGVKQLLVAPPPPPPK